MKSIFARLGCLFGAHFHSPIWQDIVVGEPRLVRRCVICGRHWYDTAPWWAIPVWVPFVPERGDLE